jgi:hypothetical protein
MDVVTTISTVLGSVKTATDIAKLLKDSDISLEKAEAKLKLAELIGALADVKMQFADVRELLIEKDDEIRKLKDDLKVRENLVFEMPYYWIKTKDDKKDGPFCQACYDKNNKLIRLQGDGTGFWQCQVCKNSYTDSNYDASSYTDRISF